MPAIGEVWNVNGCNVVLSQRHRWDQNVWVATERASGIQRFVSNEWMVANPTARISQADDQPGLVPEPVPAPVPQPVLRRRTVDVAEQVVRAALDEDPAENEDPAPTQQSECPACHDRYTGVLGVDHQCVAVMRVACTACNKVNPSDIARPVRPFFLCPECVTRGIRVCKKCGEASVIEHSLCEECDKIKDESVWFRVGMRAVGNDIVQEVKSHRPYSVEIECFLMPANTVMAVGNPGEFWEKVGDGSITGDRGNSGTAEFRSPPHKGDSGLAKIYTAVNNIRSMGYRANRTCGLHVHIDAIDTTELQRGYIRKFCSWIEGDIFKLVARNRRGNQYCSDLGGATSRGDRYRWLNLEAYEKHGTLEFRLHHGTTQPERTVEWVKVCLSMFEMGLQIGRLANKPDSSLFHLLGFSAYQVKYWTTVAKSLHGDAVTFGR
jgi:hypothetical protein